MSEDELHRSLISWSLAGSKRRSKTQPPGNTHGNFLNESGSFVQEYEDGDIVMKPVCALSLREPLNGKAEQFWNLKTSTESPPPIYRSGNTSRLSRSASIVNISRESSIPQVNGLLQKETHLDPFTRPSPKPFLMSHPLPHTESVSSTKDSQAVCVTSSCSNSRNHFHNAQLHLQQKSSRPVCASVIQPEDVSTKHTPSKEYSSQIFHHLQFLTILARILNNYLYVLLNLCIVLSLVFGISRFVLALHRDLTKRVALQRRELLAKARLCQENYIKNRCEPELRVPALADLCVKWETCMSTLDLASHREAATTAEILGNVIHSFFDQFSFKSMVLLSGSTLLTFWALRCLLKALRDPRPLEPQYIESQQSYTKPTLSF